MRSQKVAAKYANALFQVSGTTEEVQARQEQLKSLAAILREHPKTQRIFSCPEVSIDAKLEVISKFLQKPLNPHLKNLLHLVLKRRHSPCLERIFIDYNKLVRNQLQQLDVEVEAATLLDPATCSRLIQKLEQQESKAISLNETEKPSLLGGFSLQVGNQHLDLSLGGRLKQLKKQLLKVEP
ncbi:MAG: ATP synthase F1 subunit delta [Parachlamydiaceae bacterium]|nr:ATP synthase F1 subunit delta [Parachlamydiaceae bacterium]